MSYADHTLWSDPGNAAGMLADLPADLVALSDSLEGFLIHHAAARRLGFGVPDRAEGDRNLRRAERLLQTAAERDDRPLTMLRQLPDYLYGTCHDFALLALSALRTRGVEARLRVGFVDYFLADRWEDHWLCEYRHDGEWRLLDAQLGWRAREAVGIDFPVDNVPRKSFLPAAEAWIGIRSGKLDEQAFGVSFAGITGAWFVASSVLRDAAALAAVETLPWDYWGPARDFVNDRAVADDAVPAIDRLAAALVPAPETLEQARQVLDAHDWARPEATVLSAVGDVLRERDLA